MSKPRHETQAETTQPMAPPAPLDPDHPDHPAVRFERRRRVDRDLKILKRQIAFLFFLIVFAMVVLSIYQQVNMNRIEYDRYDLCVIRQGEIAAYNQLHADSAPPITTCGKDPRTD